MAAKFTETTATNKGRKGTWHAYKGGKRVFVPGGTTASSAPAAPLATRVKADPALLARALRDPGLRAKLPDKYLTAAQVATRKHNQYLGDIGDIGTPLQGTSLVNAAQQITDADYAPLLANIGQQETVANKSAGLQHDWAKSYYGNLNGLVSSVGAQQATANANATQAAAAQGAATQAAIGGADQAAQARMAADAAVRGGGLQGSAPADLAARTAAAQQTAAGDASRAQTSAQQFGDAQSAFLKGLQGATAQQGGEYQQQITGAASQALQQLAANRADLQGKQAGSYTDTLLKLRSGEQQNAITAAGLGIKQDAAGAAADASAGSGGQKYGYTPSEWLALPASTRTAIVAAANKKAPKSKTASDKKTEADLAYFKIHGYYPPTGPPKKGSGKSGEDGRATNVQIGAAQDGSTSALADAKKLYDAGVKDRSKLAAYLLQGSKGTTKDVLDPKTGKPVLVTDPKTGATTKKTVSTGSVDKHDPLFTSIALDVLIDGHISRYNAGRLHSRGLKVEDLGYPSYTDSQKNVKKAQNSPSQRAPGGT